MIWRWDQGRLEYFRFDNIRAVARVLAALEGVPLDHKAGDPLRVPLGATGLPFLPTHYRVWRNHARVFGAAGLATEVGGRLRVTGLCKALAQDGVDQLTVDDYFAFLVSRFYFPWPAFQGYSHTGPIVFPFCAILRYLMTHVRKDGFGAVTLDEVFSKLIGSNCRGDEPLAFYQRLPSTGRAPVGDERRQIREFLSFFSQFSFLHWTRPDTLFLDVDATRDEEALTRLEELAQPIRRRRLADRDQELLSLLGTFEPITLAEVIAPPREIPEDLVFTEGSRVRTNHLRIERSPKLRALLFNSLGSRPPCDVCRRDLRHHYPWADYPNMLEVHHLLPLGSALEIRKRETSLADLTALCRNCHGGVHVYYRQWLGGQGLVDFRSKDEAKTVYRESKDRYVA